MALSLISTVMMPASSLKSTEAYINNKRTYDMMRDRIIAARGLRVLRFQNERLFTDLFAVLREIQTAADGCQSSTSPAL